MKIFVYKGLVLWKLKKADQTVFLGSHQRIVCLEDDQIVGQAFFNFLHYWEINIMIRIFFNIGPYFSSFYLII